MAQIYLEKLNQLPGQEWLTESTSCPNIIGLEGSRSVGHSPQKGHYNSEWRGYSRRKTQFLKQSVPSGLVFNYSTNWHEKKYTDTVRHFREQTKRYGTCPKELTIKIQVRDGKVGLTKRWWDKVEEGLQDGDFSF